MLYKLHCSAHVLYCVFFYYFLLSLHVNDHILRPDLSSLTKLKHLFLDDNKLTGDLTSAFNLMSYLKTLYIDDNGFSGYIDGQVCYMYWCMNPIVFLCLMDASQFRLMYFYCGMMH